MAAHSRCVGWLGQSVYQESQAVWAGGLWRSVPCAEGWQCGHDQKADNVSWIYDSLGLAHETVSHSKEKDIGGETQVDENYIKVMYVDRDRKNEFFSNTWDFCEALNCKAKYSLEVQWFLRLGTEPD